MTKKTNLNTVTETNTKATAETKTADKPETTTKEKPKAISKAKTEESKTENVQTSEQTAETTAIATTVENDVYSPEMAKEAMKLKNRIRLEYGKVEKSFLVIAFSLHWLYYNRGYKPLGYDNIYDFAKTEFEIARGTCNNFINVVERFGARDELGRYTGEIAPEYEAFSSSKLILMLNLTDEEIKNLSPALSCRELKKQIALLIDKAEETEQVTTGGKGGFSQSFESDEESVDFTINRQALINCVGKDDYESKVDKIDEYILRAFEVHPNCKIEIVCVTAEEEKESTGEITESEE